MPPRGQRVISCYIGSGMLYHLSRGRVLLMADNPGTLAHVVLSAFLAYSL